MSTSTKGPRMAKKKLTWTRVKRLICAQVDEFLTDLVCIGESDNDMVREMRMGKENLIMPVTEVLKWTKGKLNVYRAELPFCTLEWDGDRDLVVLSHFSSESPESGFHVDKDYVKIRDIDALKHFLMSAYFKKLGRQIQEAD